MNCKGGAAYVYGRTGRAGSEDRQPADPERENVILGDRAAGRDFTGSCENACAEEYTTIINPQKISGAVSCYFEIETKPDMLAEVAEILKKNDTITQIYRVTGKSRLHVHAVASSNEEMEELICNTMDNLPGVVACTCNTILSRIKDIKGLRL